MAIKPYTYGSTPTLPGNPGAPEVAPATAKIKPYTYAAPATPSLTPAEQGLVDKIPKPAPGPSFMDRIKSFITPFGAPAIKDPNRPGTMQSLPPVTIKAPFVNKGITFEHGGVPEQLIGGLVEWPERLARSIGQYGQVLATGKYTPQTKEPGKLTVDTTLESMDAFHKGMTDNGMSDTQASWIAGLYGGSAGALDLLGLEGILQKGVAKIAAQSVVDPAELSAAKTLLGNPKDLKTAETAYRNIQKMSHPDMPGANAKLSTQASQAMEIVRKADKEGALGVVARGAQQAQKPVSELFGMAKPAPKPVAGLIPETAGKIAPFEYSKAESPKIPLKAPETPGIPEKPAIVPKPVESPAIPAAPAVEGVAAPVVTPEPVPAPETRKLSVVPEEVKGAAKERVLGPGNTTEVPLKIGGERVSRPTLAVTKTDLRNMADTLPGKEADFTVIEQNGKKLMQYENEGTKMLLRPSALGLVEDNIKVGDSVRISKEMLKKPGTSMRAVDENGNVVASLKSDLEDGGVNPAKNVDELKKKVEQLNKFGQQQAILRRTGNTPKNAYGVFRSPTKKGLLNSKVSDRGEVNLQDSTVASPHQYMSTLSHELGHALEYTMTGKINAETLSVFGKTLTDAEKKVLIDELKAITNKMVGEEAAKSGAGYYYQKTELLARFLQQMFLKPGEVAELAPNAVAALERSAVENPIIQEYLDAVYGAIDKGERKFIFLRDMKQTYQKVLGTRVGEMAWNDEMRYRAMKERAKIQVEKLIKEKFKGVKDAPETLFRAAESIKVTKDGVPEFGTRDFQHTNNDKEAAKLMMAGWEPVLDGNGKIVTQLVDGEQVARFAKPRYTPETAKRIFESLSPEGKQLVKDFTADRDSAKDYFNREVIKDVHKINSDLEGWVHHYWDEKGMGLGGDRIKTKVAAAKKHRAGAEGYVEDLQKAMQKALTELETTKAYNSFIDDYFARVSKPIQKGGEPDPGWIEVQGNVRKSGIARPGEVRKVILEKGKAPVVAGEARYQMPAEIYKRFQMIRELSVEASTMAKVMNDVNRYWRINILFHPGSTSTNFVSGALQYSTKVLTDFYVEALTGAAKFPKTRKNIFSMLTTLSPKGWQAAPDWIYGGDLSNWYGEFTSGKTPGTSATKAVDFYGDHALKFYGTVERYWKKVIALSEDAGKLGSLNKMDKNGLRLPTEEEKALLDEINKEIDLFAYDYDNVPTWLESHQQSTLGQAIKPFAKYPYKFTKQVTEMIHQAFDGTLPWQERAAKVLALSTVIGLYAAHSERRKHQQKTPEVGPSAPPSVSTRGRLFMGTDKEGNEMFTRVAKYPFLNISEAGLQLAHGHSDTGLQIFQDMLGSISPIGDIGLAVMGYGNQYQQYQPIENRVGQGLATFVPGSRVLADISRFFDPYQRKQSTFLQAFTSMYPTTDEALQDKLHGAIKTIQVPLEDGITPQAGEGTKRTTTDALVKNYKTDVLLGLLAGLYTTRIDPDVAEAFNTRADENAVKAKKKEEKDALQKLSKP